VWSESIKVSHKGLNEALFHLRRVGMFQRARKGLQPAACHFLVRHRPGLLWIDIQDHMPVVAHNTVRIHRHCEALGQFQDAIFDPLAAMLKALAGQLVLPAQEGTPDTTADAMIPDYS